MKTISILYKKLIKKSQLDISYFARGGFFVFLQQIIGIGSGLFVSYLFGHYVSKTNFGEYNLILSVLSLLTFLSLPAIDIALTQSIARGYEDSFFKTLKTRVLFSAISIPILLLFSLYYFWIGKQIVSLGLLFSTPFMPILYSLQSFQAYYVAKKQFGKVAKFASFSSLIYLFFFTIVIFFSPSALGLTIAYLLSSILPSMVGSFSVIRSIRKSKRSDHGLIPYGFFLTFNNALAWIAGNLGSIFLGTIMGADELAIYAAAMRLPSSVQKIYASFSKLVTAKIAGQNSQEHRFTIEKHWWKFILFGFGLAAVLWLTLPIAVTFLFPKDYTEAATYARWLSVEFIILPLSWALTDIIIFQKRKKAQFLINIFPNIPKVASYIIIIPLWKAQGLIGIAIADEYIIFALYLFAFLRSKSPNSSTSLKTS